jgi:FkbM family methyltransferase
MSHRLADVARERFGHLTDKTEREHAAELFLVESHLGQRSDGVFVEVGANEPRYLSQTWFFEQQGWTGLLIEPIPELCARLRAERPRSRVVQVACGAPEQRGEVDFHVASDSGKSSLGPQTLAIATEERRVERVRLRTLDDVLDEAALPRIDLLSIDVEGFQLDVLRGLTLTRHRPALLLVEDHLLDLRTHRHVTRQGYRLVKRTGLNDWYVPQESPFALTDVGERFALWRKVHLRTPVRRFTHALKKRRALRAA